MAAIALKTGCAKDHARVLQFLESGALAADRFESIIARHELLPLWDRFEKRFLDLDSP